MGNKQLPIGIAGSGAVEVALNVADAPVVGLHDRAEPLALPGIESGSGPAKRPADRFANGMGYLASRSVPRIPIARKAVWLARLEPWICLLSSAAPALLLSLVDGRDLSQPSLVASAVAVSAATLVSWCVLAELRRYARTRLLSYVFPVTFVMFSVALAALTVPRLPFSMLYLTVGAISATASLFLTAVYRRRLSHPYIVVSGGQTGGIKLEGEYLYLPASRADVLEQWIAAGHRDWSIVADLHYPHSAPMERAFAVAALHGIPVYHVRRIFEMQSGQVSITHLGENDLGSLIPTKSFTSVKRAIDIIGAIILLPLCAPLFFIIGAAIRLDSPGDAFFIQDRVGFRGRPFRMIKFRTMRARAAPREDQRGLNEAKTQTDDDRITTIGRFLRKTRLDELPQIYNVLRGEMSFIGPRPEAAALSQWYEGELPFYIYRHIVRPGITGWAQVNQGHVTEMSDVLTKLRFDFYYIRNLSLWLDVLVCLKTIRVIMTGFGAK